jgi:catechol 2,3-dioxygenase-like lactoylglutathione lyase family enzyme
MITNLHHVAILTSDLDKAVRFYVDLLDCPMPKIAEVDKPNIRLRSAMVPIGNGETFLQILEPEIGPGKKELAERGEGALFEMAFQTDDIEQFAIKMQTEGITPSNLAEQPIKEKYIQSKFGNRYFILPGKQLRGTRTEIVQVMASKEIR